MTEPTYTMVSHLYDAAADYDWAAFVVYRRDSDGAMFWAAEAGCSCDGPGENPGESDMRPLPAAPADLRRVISSAFPCSQPPTVERIAAFADGLAANEAKS
jgi:hypothetical protein